ncbi:hypothetical protein BVY04_04735 [bacterium M21]|nr:hypothetical protein BVY04_04735 [bacterium M21]
MKKMLPDKKSNTENKTPNRDLPVQLEDRRPKNESMQSTAPCEITAQRMIVKESTHRGYASKKSGDMDQKKFRDNLCLFSGSGEITKIDTATPEGFLTSQVYASEPELKTALEQQGLTKEKWAEWGQLNLGKGLSPDAINTSRDLFEAPFLAALELPQLRAAITKQLNDNQDAYVYSAYEDLKYSMTDKDPVHLLSPKDMVEAGDVPAQDTQGAFEQANKHQSCVIEALSGWNINVPGSDPVKHSLEAWYQYFVAQGKDFRTDVDYGGVLVGTLGWTMVSNAPISWTDFLTGAENGNYLAGSYQGEPQGGSVGHMIGFKVAGNQLDGALIDSQGIAARPADRWLKYVFKK